MAPANVTVGELIERWLDLERDTLSVTTWEAYAGTARFRLAPALGTMSVRDLGVREIDALYRSLSREQGLAPSTVRPSEVGVRRRVRESSSRGHPANPADAAFVRS